jgi:MerR family transcriptional regulator, heat shock protein HspR
MLTRSGNRVFAAGTQGDVIPLRAGQRARKSNQVVVWNPLRWALPPTMKIEK